MLSEVTDYSQRSDDSGSLRVRCRLCAIRLARLLQDAADVPLHGVDANHKLVGDVRVGFACRDQSQYLYLALRQTIGVGCQLSAAFRPWMTKARGKLHRLGVGKG